MGGYNPLMILRSLAAALCLLGVLAGCSSEAPPEPKTEAEPAASVAPDEGYKRVDQVIDPVALHAIAWSTSRVVYGEMLGQAPSYSWERQDSWDPLIPTVAQYKVHNVTLHAHWHQRPIDAEAMAKTFANTLRIGNKRSVIWVAVRDRLVLALVMPADDSTRAAFRRTRVNHSWFYELLSKVDATHAARTAFPEGFSMQIYP